MKRFVLVSRVLVNQSPQTGGEFFKRNHADWHNLI